MYLKIFFGVCILYLVGSLIYYFRNREGFILHIGRLRKSLYVMFLTALCLGFILQEMNYKDWQLLLQMTAFIVFVDLAVFQTPNILKIFNAELQHEDLIRETLEKNQRTLGFVTQKANTFTAVIQESEDYFMGKQPVSSWTEYEKELCEYVSKYTGFFDFNLKLFLIPDYQNQEELVNAIMVSLEQVERRYNVNIEDMEDVSNRLADAESLPLVIEELFIVPFYGQHTYLALVSSKDVEVTGIDALNIVNLISIFEWEMC